MADRWYYRHDGRTLGPLTAAEIEQLAITGQLHPADLIWAEGADPSTATPAQASVRFPALLVPPQPLPDWLGDVQKSEVQGQRSGVGKSSPRPDPQITRVPQRDAVPNWLEDVRRAERTTRAHSRERPAPANDPAAAATAGSRQGNSIVLTAVVVTATLLVLVGLAVTGGYLLTGRLRTPEADELIDKDVSDLPASEIAPVTKPEAEERNADSGGVRQLSAAAEQESKPQAVSPPESSDTPPAANRAKKDESDNMALPPPERRNSRPQHKAGQDKGEIQGPVAKPDSTGQAWPW